MTKIIEHGGTKTQSNVLFSVPQRLCVETKFGTFFQEELFRQK